MDELDGLDDLDEQIAALERSAGGASAVTAGFAAELSRTRRSLADTGREVAVLSGGINRGLRRSIEGLVFDGDKLSDALRGVAQSMSRASYSAAVKPVFGRLGGVLAQGIEGAIDALAPFGTGAGFAQGRVMPFAMGGVVTTPTSFPMRGGRGLMGEAGPEAILPLARGADGRLGIAAAGGERPIKVVMNIATPDVQSFQRSQSQIASQLGRALGRGQRNR